MNDLVQMAIKEKKIVKTYNMILIHRLRAYSHLKLQLLHLIGTCMLNKKKTELIHRHISIVAMVACTTMTLLQFYQ